jgi:hypothetical protein
VATRSIHLSPICGRLTIMSTARKVFHCAVDDTALTTNISEIKKWIANGAITLFVPLYSKFILSVPLASDGNVEACMAALERLRTLKKAGSQVAINAREAVRFLDRITSGRDGIPANGVALQGPMEQYDTWAEAEKFVLTEFEEEAGDLTEDVSETSEPFKECEEHEELTENAKDGKDVGPSNDLSQMLLNKLNFKKEPETASLPSTGTHSAPGSRSSSRSSRTSPELAVDRASMTPRSPQAHSSQHGAAGSSSVSSMPIALRPLLSALLWRLHTDPVKSCILVTNDRNTQTWAQKFGITTKNIHQLRTAIQYEEREYKNRCKYMEKTHATEPRPLFSYENDSDEDELVFVPRVRGRGGMRGGSARGANSRKSTVSKAVSPTETTAVGIPSEPIDPDSFNRSFGVPTKPPVVDLSSQSGAARGLAAASRRYPGGRRGSFRGSTRGGGRGRGKLWVP